MKLLFRPLCGLLALLCGGVYLFSQPITKTTLHFRAEAGAGNLMMPPNKSITAKARYAIAYGVLTGLSQPIVRGNFILEMQAGLSRFVYQYDDVATSSSSQAIPYNYTDQITAAQVSAGILFLFPKPERRFIPGLYLIYNHYISDCKRSADINNRVFTIAIPGIYTSHFAVRLYGEYILFAKLPSLRLGASLTLSTNQVLNPDVSPLSANYLLAAIGAKYYLSRK
jgi:hypothetical protein